METLWFWAVGYMLVMYVILDGYDLGTGIIHIYAGKSDLERRLLLKTIGPVWDGNEVWLIAAGHGLTHWYPATFYLLLLFALLVLRFTLLR